MLTGLHLHAKNEIAKALLDSPQLLACFAKRHKCNPTAWKAHMFLPGTPQQRAQSPTSVNSSVSSSDASAARGLISVVPQPCSPMAARDMHMCIGSQHL